MPEILEVVDVDGGPYGVTVDETGTLWFTLAARGAVGRLVDGTVETVALEPADGSPTVIVAEGDGAWFTEFRGNRIGRVEANGALSFLAAESPYGLCRAGDGGLWYTELSAGGVVHRAPDGTATRYAVEGMPSMIAEAADGTVFVTLNQGNAVARITPDGQVRTTALPTVGAGPVGLATAADGAWFVELLAGQLGHVDRDGTVTEHPLPDRDARPHAVVVAPDGTVWFTEWAAARLGRRTADGEITELALPGAEPHGLTVAPDGTLWVAMESGALVHVRP
ncbi:Virginiamycin B lyase [Nocardia farcinica]|uniref:Vgb family protein n=1 Tax=Nocardia farcinica TaxID=37329 RepID=UPI000BF300C4|nr:virginiamycin B lyase [Nocardia farcinica]PFX04887.1 Virginiamycin B lyase [Nocardia farcinica]PFX09522.1 Virginiamycin B lyase [Nocardia farcinica]